MPHMNFVATTIISNNNQKIIYLINNIIIIQFTICRNFLLINFNIVVTIFKYFIIMTFFCMKTIKNCHYLKYVFKPQAYNESVYYVSAAVCNIQKNLFCSSSVLVYFVINVNLKPQVVYMHLYVF